jgi:hypothetical protein
VRRALLKTSLEGRKNDGNNIRTDRHNRRTGCEDVNSLIWLRILHNDGSLC